MKEQDIRDKLNAFMGTGQDQQLPVTVVAYATSLTPISLYSCPMPKEEIKMPDVYQPWVIQPIPPLPEGVVPEEKTPPYVTITTTSIGEPPEGDKTNDDLEGLIEAILNLKGQTVEVYTLKALACAVRERNDLDKASKIAKIRQAMKTAPYEDHDLHMGGEEESRRGQAWLDSEADKDK